MTIVVPTLFVETSYIEHPLRSGRDNTEKERSSRWQPRFFAAALDPSDPAHQVDQAISDPSNRSPVGPSRHTDQWNAISHTHHSDMVSRNDCPDGSVESNQSRQSIAPIRRIDQKRVESDRSVEAKQLNPDLGTNPLNPIRLVPPTSRVPSLKRAVALTIHTSQFNVIDQSITTHQIHQSNRTDPSDRPTNKTDRPSQPVIQTDRSHRTTIPTKRPANHTDHSVRPITPTN